MTSTSYPVFRALETLGGVFDGVAAVQVDSMTTGRGSELTEVAAVQASGDTSRRSASSRRPVASSAPPMTSCRRQRRGRHQSRLLAAPVCGEPSAIGQQLVVDDQLLTIIGVAPRGFNGTELGATDVFVPLTTAMRKRGAGWWSDARIRMVAVVARLRDGVTTASAASLVARRFAKRRPDGAGRPADGGARVRRAGPSARQSPQARIALWLSGVSLVVLLIATANVGTLLLLRAARRRRDVAVRIAARSRRRHLARQSLIESLLLALAGCGIGLLLSRWFARHRPGDAAA